MDVNLDGNTITNAYLSDIVATGAVDLSDALLTLPPLSVDISNINATGTPSSTTYLRGDGTWSTAGGGAITLTGDATGSGTGTIPVTVDGINGTSLAGLATGLLKNTTSTGVPSVAVAGTDYLAPSAIGTTVQAYNANTTTLGNSVNGASELVQTNASTQYPALDGSLINGLFGPNVSSSNSSAGTYSVTLINRRSQTASISNINGSGVSQTYELSNGFQTGDQLEITLYSASSSSTTTLANASGTALTNGSFTGITPGGYLRVFGYWNGTTWVLFAQPSVTIGTNVVTNSQLAQMAANTIKSNLTGSTANAADNTVASVQTALDASNHTFLGNHNTASNQTGVTPNDSDLINFNQLVVAVTTRLYPVTPITSWSGATTGGGTAGAGVALFSLATTTTNPSSGIAFTFQRGITSLTGNMAYNQIDFSRKLWVMSRIQLGSSNGANPNRVMRFCVNKGSNTTGAPTQACIGWKIIFDTANVGHFYAEVYGSSLQTSALLATISTSANNCHTLLMNSNGSGTVTYWLDGASLGTQTGAPSGTGSASNNNLSFEILNSGDAAATGNIAVFTPTIFVEN